MNVLKCAMLVRLLTQLCSEGIKERQLLVILVLAVTTTNNPDREATPTILVLQRHVGQTSECRQHTQ